MKAPIPPDMLHHDSANMPIQVGSWIVMVGNSYSFLYGYVTELVNRNGYPAIKMKACRTDYRQKDNRYEAHAYTPTVGTSTSSTKKLDKILVVNEASIHPEAVRALRGIKKDEGSISDSLATVDSL